MRLFTPALVFALFLPCMLPAQTISIREAKQRGVNQTVTVAGRVTVANQFGGPSYLQDATGGIAVFNTAFHSAVQIGDSVTVTGTTTEFQNNNVAGQGLFQLSGTVTFTVHPVERRVPTAKRVRMREVSEAIEAELIEIQNVFINAFEQFGGNVNYSMSDDTGNLEVRIGTSTNLANSPALSGPLTLRGVVSEFRGIRQILPRFQDDLIPGALPSAALSTDETLDVVTWNIEWFGSSINGPTNVTLQIENAARVIERIGADVYALQEISDASAFAQLRQRLPGYRGFQAQYSSTQKTAFLFKTSVIDSLSSGLLPLSAPSGSPDPFAGRLPQFFRTRVKIPGREPQEILFINIHAKAMADADSYNRRRQAASLVKAYLDITFSTVPIIYLGDYNDDLLVSTFNREISPYKIFIDDSTAYRGATLPLTRRRLGTYRGTSTPIDHIIISNELFETHLNGDVHIHNVSYIPNFANTTTDHYPVVARFLFPTVTAILPEIPASQTTGFHLKNAYPNPFNPSTQIQFVLHRATPVKLSVFDLTGREVASLLSGEHLSAGEHRVTWNAGSAASGMYLVVMESGGVRQLLKISLIK